MPVGCMHQFIVVQRTAVQRALEKADKENDRNRQQFAQALLASPHSDDHLIAIEDMGGTDWDIENLKYLGLQGMMAKIGWTISPRTQRSGLRSGSCMPRSGSSNRMEPSAWSFGMGFGMWWTVPPRWLCGRTRTAQPSPVNRFLVCHRSRVGSQSPNRPKNHVTPYRNQCPTSSLPGSGF